METKPTTERSLVIADSSALISLLIEDDANHARALRVAEELTRSDAAIMIPCDVLSETINLLGKQFGHDKAVKAAGYLIGTPPFVIQDGTLDVWLTTLRHFANQPASVSFTDCSVMAFADEYQTREIFGFDEAFSKNGYTMLGTPTAGAA